MVENSYSTVGMSVLFRVTKNTRRVPVPRTFKTRVVCRRLTRLNSWHNPFYIMYNV